MSLDDFDASTADRIASVPRPRYRAPIELQLEAAMDALDDLDDKLGACVALLHSARPFTPAPVSVRIDALLVELGEEVPK